jgi:hypothetical protein
MGGSAYIELLRKRQVQVVVGSSIFVGLSTGIPLAIVILVQHETGSFADAGPQAGAPYRRSFPRPTAAEAPDSRPGQLRKGPRQRGPFYFSPPPLPESQGLSRGSQRPTFAM